MKKFITLFASITFLLLYTAVNVNAQVGWTPIGNHIYNPNNGPGGFVGIGTNAAPGKLLDVFRNTTEPTIRVFNTGGLGGATFQMTDAATNGDWKFKVIGGGHFKIRDMVSGLDVFFIEKNAAANAIYIKQGGNVGIRTTTPQALFHVAEVPGNYTGVFGTPISAWSAGTNFSIGNDDFSSLLYVGQSGSYKGFLIWNYNADPALGAFWVGTYNGTNPLILQPVGGNVGVNTYTPGAKLEVRYDDYTYSQLGLNNPTGNYFYHDEQELGGGQSTIYSYRTRFDFNDGTGYGNSNINTAINGLSYWGDAYSFGTTGFNYNDYTRCGGVLGANIFGDYWGALGYRTSGGTNYGGYATSWGTGSGKSSQASTGIGMGAWGDLMGADIHGKIYGVYAEGENYAMFSNGVVYNNDLEVNLQDNGTGTKTVLYTNTSTDVTVQTSGIAQLSSGRASIKFDEAFVKSISSGEPIVVTVTPLGSSNGVFLSEVTSAGCTVMENNAGKSNVTVNYIAIGKRAGYEQPKLAKEVIDAAYVDKLARGLHNDNDLETDGEGLYYENGQLVVGIHPSTLPDPNKPIEKPALKQVDNDSDKDNGAGVRQQDDRR